MNIYFDRLFAWLKRFTYHLVPVLAPNCKQHILSPAEVIKLCYSLAELYVKCDYLNLFRFRGGGASYKTSGTSAQDGGTQSRSDHFTPSL
jgi:hypothetical protein